MSHIVVTFRGDISLAEDIWSISCGAGLMRSPGHASTWSQSADFCIAREPSSATGGRAGAPAQALSAELLCAVITDLVPSCNEWQAHWLGMRLDSAEQAECVQEAQEAHLQKDLSDGLLCAVINNNTRCYNESTEFADHLDDTLAPPYKARSPYQAASACAALKTSQQSAIRARTTCQKMTSTRPSISGEGWCALQGRLDVEAQCRGFLELSKEAVSHLVSSIFSDAAFLELFHKLFCSEDWQQGTTTDSILATVGDYLEEFEHLIEAFWFKRYALYSCLLSSV